MNFYLWRIQNVLHVKQGDKDELLPCERYVTKRSQSVFCTKKNISTAAILCESCLHVTNKRFKSNYWNFIHIDKGKLHNVDFINNPGSLIPCLLPGFVYTTILCVVFCILYRPRTKWWFSIPRLSSKERSFTSK